MIINAEIIHQPYSGEFTERIYDNESVWNSQNWTFVKFTDHDYTEWCGNFRGFPVQVAVSTIYDKVIVLTLDYLYLLDRQTGNCLEFEDAHFHKDITLAPDGSFILTDSEKLKKVTITLENTNDIESPFDMAFIKFKEWNDEKLEFTCDEYLEWDRHFTMTYNNKTDLIEVKEAV